ncbi:hypothetical protein J7643_06385 [bacterium]|nr:hypothetical protein [bacterium]
MSWSFLPARRLLLTAGPRAGKTRLLRQWIAESPSETLYLRLTPEDRDPEFLAYRLLGARPAAYARFVADPRPAWGERLVAALGLMPDLALFLDDAHAIEESPLVSGLVELAEHLPMSCALVVASRHRLPSLESALEAVWSSDHPAWDERPTFSDLVELPLHLLAKTFSLALVGEASPSPEGQELIRRNVAEQAAERHVLRKPWRQVLAEIQPHEVTPSVWEVVEHDLLTFWDQHRWTIRGEGMLEKIARLPASSRALRPTLLEIEGQAYFDAFDYEAAYARFEQALALRPASQHDQQRLALQRLEARFRLDGVPPEEELACIAPALADPSSLLRARALLNQGRWLAIQGKHPEAAQCWEDVAQLGAQPDRTLAMLGIRAEANLHAWATLRDDLTVARRHRRRIHVLSRRWGFERSTSQALLTRTREEILDESRPSTFELQWDPSVPLPPGMRAYMLDYLGHRARYLGEGGLALRCFDHLERLASTHALSYEVQLARLGRMMVHTQSGELARARAEYEAMDLSEAPMSWGDAAHVYWVRCLLELGEYDEAAREIPAASSPFMRVHWEFLRRWLDHLQGQGSLEAIRALVDSPEGRFLRRIEARALRDLGLATLPPIFKLRVFGAFEIERLGAPAPAWPRRRSLALLAMLGLQPDGLETDKITEQIFWDWLPSNPRDSLHGLSYAARKALRSIGGEHLIESSRGRQRLVGEEFAYNELKEFETFFRQGMKHQEVGDRDLAAYWFTIALHHVSGDPCENLPELEPRLLESLRDRIQQARLGAGFPLRG